MALRDIVWDFLFAIVNGVFIFKKSPPYSLETCNSLFLSKPRRNLENLLESYVLVELTVIMILQKSTKKKVSLFTDLWKIERNEDMGYGWLVFLSDNVIKLLAKDKK